MIIKSICSLIVILSVVKLGLSASINFKDHKNKEILGSTFFPVYGTATASYRGTRGPPSGTQHNSVYGGTPARPVYGDTPEPDDPVVYGTPAGPRTETAYPNMNTDRPIYGTTPRPVYRKKSDYEEMNKISHHLKNSALNEVKAGTPGYPEEKNFKAGTPGYPEEKNFKAGTPGYPEEKNFKAGTPGYPEEKNFKAGTPGNLQEKSFKAGTPGNLLEKIFKAGTPGFPEEKSVNDFYDELTGEREYEEKSYGKNDLNKERTFVYDPKAPTPDYYQDFTKKHKLDDELNDEKESDEKMNEKSDLKNKSAFVYDPKAPTPDYYQDFTKKHKLDEELNDEKESEEKMNEKNDEEKS